MSLSTCVMATPNLRPPRTARRQAVEDPEVDALWSSWIGENNELGMRQPICDDIVAAIELKAEYAQPLFGCRHLLGIARLFGIESIVDQRGRFCRVDEEHPFRLTTDRVRLMLPALLFIELRSQIIACHPQQGFEHVALARSAAPADQMTAEPFRQSKAMLIAHHRNGAVFAQRTVCARRRFIYQRRF